MQTCKKLICGIVLILFTVSLTGCGPHIENGEPFDIRTPIGYFFGRFDLDVFPIPLVEACRKGEVEKAAELLENGADPNDGYVGYWTPLEAACVSPLGNKDSLALIKLLLDYGADPTHITGEELPQFMLASYLDNTRLSQEKRLSYVEAIDLLLDNGAALRNDSCTLLHMAAWTDSVELAQILVEKYHIDVDELDEDGKTALEKAVECGSTNVRDYLMIQQTNEHEKG